MRAGKTTLFEGGVRGVSIVAGGLLPAAAAGSEVFGLLQHVDIPATFAALADTTLPLADGFNVWDTLTMGAPSPRTEVPVNVDPSDCTLSNGTSYSALIVNEWKLIVGFPGFYDGWWANGAYQREEPDAKSAGSFVDGQTVWLFNLTADPTERVNLAHDNLHIVEKMGRRLSEYAGAGFVKAQDNTLQPESLPSLHEGVWAPFKSSSDSRMQV